MFVGRPRKAGPPPERKLEGSIDVIGGEGSRGTSIYLLSILLTSFIHLLRHTTAIAVTCNHTLPPLCLIVGKEKITHLIAGCCNCYYSELLRLPRNTNEEVHNYLLCASYTGYSKYNIRPSVWLIQCSEAYRVFYTLGTLLSSVTR